MYPITSVRRALSEDVDARLRRYAFSMGVRTVFLVVAILAPSPWSWISLAAAVVIPVVAVLVANAGRELPSGSGSDVDPWGLPAGPSGAAWDAGGNAHDAGAGGHVPRALSARPWTNDPTAEYLR